MKKKILSSLAALTIAFGAVAVVAAPAQAAAPQAQVQTAQARSLADCDLHQLCTWKSNNFTGSLYFYTLTGMSDGQCTNIGGTWNNAINSVAMAEWVYEARFYTGSNCSGNFITFVTGDVVAYEKATCLNNYSSWVTSVSPCSAPTASSFKVWIR